MSKSQYKFKSWLVNNEEYPAQAEITLSYDMKALTAWESELDHILHMLHHKSLEILLK